MTLPVDSLIAYTLEKMQERIVQKADNRTEKYKADCCLPEMCMMPFRVDCFWILDFLRWIRWRG